MSAYRFGCFRGFVAVAIVCCHFSDMVAAGTPGHQLEHACGVTCEQRVPPPVSVLRPLDRSILETRSLRGAAGGEGAGGLEDGSVIDILVVYTPQATAGNGGQSGIESLILMGLDELNTAAADSLVGTAFRVVHMQEVAYTQSGSMGGQLQNLREPGDGVLDEVHDLRDAHKADLVMMVVSNGDTCGIANIGVGPGNTPTPENAFSVVSALCLTGPVSAFAHEVGHNLGLLHGYEENPCTNGGSRFGKGFQPADESFNTVMGTGVGPRVLRFSNPDADFNGQATGVEVGAFHAADAASALALAAPVVAKYRSRDMNENGIADVDDITAGTLADCNTNGYPDFAEQDFNRNGIPDECDIAGGSSGDLDGDGVPDESEPSRLYVDADALGSGTGVSWGEAFTDLQPALALARASGDVDEIWIAQGVYLPATGGLRAAQFDLVSGVSLYGGFAGTETSIEQRVDGANPTVLSGDQNGDDQPDLSGRQDNSINVLMLFNQPDPITLDGLIIERGNADFEVNCGGFMFYAGGLVAFGGDLTINNCEFRENTAVNSGALILINDVKSKITDSWFHHNTAIDGVFYGVTGELPYDGYIGAVRINTFHNGIDNQFVGNLVEFNSDTEGISGVLFTACEPLFANNVITRNTSGSTVSGGALTMILCDGIEIINSTIAHNTAPNGTGNRAAGVVSNRSTIAVSNSIVYGNTSGSVTDQRAQFSETGAGVSHSFDNSLVEGWSGTLNGLGSSGADPLFADAGAGDFSLLAGSAAIDMGDNGRVPADGPDLDGDGDVLEALPLDFAGDVRFVDDPATADTGNGFAPIVDAGAYEYQASAPCTADLAEPFGILDLSDITTFVAGFTAQDQISDLAPPTGTFDLADITAFVSSFLAGCP